MAMGDEIEKEGDQGDLAETKRIMERLVRTPPKPHKEGVQKLKGKIAVKPPAKRGQAKDRG